MKLAYAKNSLKFRITRTVFALSGLVFAMTFVSPAKADIDYAKIEEQLKTTGLVGEVHGSVNPLGLYVLTYRTPGNFFEHAEFPMITSDAAIRSQLQELQRHDKIRVFGGFAGINAPQKHIKLTKLEKVYDHVSPIEIPEFSYPPEVRDEIKNSTSLITRVHAIAEQGRVLVVEYKGFVIPMAVNEVSHLQTSAGLYRNDKVKIHYTLQKKPGRPMHLELLKSDANAIEVMRRVADPHGTKVERTGSLVLFPKSPQVAFDVYALQVIDEDGIPTEYTLVNFEDTELFKALRQKAADGWAKSPQTAIPGRNKLVNPKIKVTARGIYNLIVFDQANPQIIINSIDDLEVSVLE